MSNVRNTHLTLNKAFSVIERNDIGNERVSFADILVIPLDIQLKLLIGIRKEIQDIQQICNNPLHSCLYSINSINVELRNC